MTRQSAAVSAILATRTKDGVRPWLSRLAALLDAETALDAATIAALVDRARPRWGVGSKDDAAAYVEFWSHLTSRHDQPALRAGYSDVLALLGPRDRAREALDIYLAAVHQAPGLFVEYSADFGDLATKLGARREFELAKIAFYAHLVEKGEMDEPDLREAVRELLAAHPDDAKLRDQLRKIAHRAFRT